MEHQESYLMTALAFIGITDVQVIRAEGVNMGEEPKAKAVKQAQKAIAELQPAYLTQLRQSA
jgi:FMN-dependent NADH-azoreductase